MDGHDLVVGTVAAIYRYPVKSMRGESLAEAHLWWHGLDGDRRFAFVKTGNLSAFPWFTGREFPDLVRYTPYFVTPDDVINSPVRVQTPEGDDVPLESPALCQQFAEHYSAPVHLMKNGRGAFDSQALSLISLASLAALGSTSGQPVDARRFRANIVLDTVDSAPFQEEQWLGGVVHFGSAEQAPRALLTGKIPRCMMINIDPDTATRQPAVLREVAAHHHGCAAVYGSTQVPGTIRVGDTVRLRRGP
jgi:uncharacterized protein